MKIPDNIRVNGTDYLIDLVEDVKDDIHGADYIARVLFKENKIRILNSYKIERKFRALLHEVIHIIDEDIKVGLEEEQICRLEAGLYQVLRDNDFLKE